MRNYFLIPMVIGFVFCSAAYAELVDNGDGTVTDTQSGLMWQQADAEAMNWVAALTYCESLNLAGYGDWRLPNRNELQSLVDYGAVNPAIDAVAFPGALSSYYWTSSTYADRPSVAWVVYFYEGEVVYNGLKSDSHYVRAVRGGQ